MKSKDKSENIKNEKNEASFTAKPRIDTDPLGSWTGTPDDPTDTPVQDADDL